MSRWPVRWRLTAWYAAAMVLILAAVGSAIYVGLRYELDDQLGEEVVARAALLGDDDWPDARRPAVPEPSADDERDQVLRVWARDGTLLVDTWRGDSGGLAPDEARRLATTGPPYARYDTVDLGGERYRRAVLVVEDAAGRVRVLEVGLTRQDVEQALRALRILFLVVVPFSLLAALAGGYALAGRALAPVGTITALARRICGDDLTERLALDLPDDELGRLADTFDAMLDRVEDAFERQRRFTGDAAHELRTPLSLIRTRVDLALARDRPAAEYRETLGELDRDVARLGGLVGTLLALARADAGMLALDRRPVDLRGTVEAVVEQYRETVGDPFILASVPTEPVVASVDEDLVIQLLVNLVDNAVAHTPPGGSIVVGCARAGEAVELAVADTGDGVAPEHLDRLFDRFYRVDAGRASAQGGVGLGLSICRTIVEAHGGTIAVASQVGSGTRVEASLPTGA